VTGRILVTGSRTWRLTTLLEFQLRIACAKYLPSAIVIVHGDCPRGADRIAAEWAARNNLRTEAHPADWRRPDGTFDRSAGYKRNAEMVRLGADLCLGFIHDGSRGATHCADLAEKAGIPVRRFTQEAR
jgi:hypothetical protein